MRKSCYGIFIFFLLSLNTPSAHGEEKVSELLPLGLSSQETEIVTTARSPRPLSRIAENVTVVTAEQIAILNAHTLMEVLQTIPGIQVSEIRTPGSWTGFNTNTLDFNHVLLFIDGVAQNDLVNNFPDAAIIPAQQIERIEIIKGAASTAWGAAMGGVVNVITKSADPERKFGGATSASFGERHTSDINGELSGTIDNIGYYFAGGNLYSRGLRPGNGANFNHAWSKLDYTLPSRGQLTVGGNIRKADRGLEESADLNWRDTDSLRYYHLFADYSQPLSEHLSLDLSGRFRRQWTQTILGYIVYGPDDTDMVTTIRQVATYTSAKLLWDKAPFTALAGIDYEHHDIIETDSQNVSLNRWAAYLNGSYSTGRLTVLPGVRHDHTGIGKNPTTYTMGATLQLTDKTLVRGYTASGYGLANTFTPDNIQKIRTVQLGIESNGIPSLWLKGTCFYSKLKAVRDNSDWTAPANNQTRQGIDLEARTLPLAGFSVSGGYVYTHSDYDETHESVENLFSQSLKAAVNYRSESIGLSGALTGNYVWWNTDSSYYAQYSAMVWNLHLTQKIKTNGLINTEIFFSGYNLFNGAQYTSDLYKNTRRWIESGVRFRF